MARGRIRKRAKKGLTGAQADCTTCGKCWQGFNALAIGRRHADNNAGHRVSVEQVYVTCYCPPPETQQR